MKILTNLEYAKTLLKIKKELLKKDFTEVELFMFDILSSKLIERESKKEHLTQVYYLHNNKDFISFLKSVRNNKLQKDFADLLKMDKANYNRVESGKQKISLDKFFSICEELGYGIELYSLPF